MAARVMNETVKTRFSLILPMLLGLALASCGAAAPREEPPLAGARIGGPFTLTDQDGRQVSDASFKGKYRIVYFGFASCPDVCPTDLAQIGQALRLFEKNDPARAAKVQPIFISVDPERDTPPKLKEYAAAFHPRLVALTGTPEQVKAAAKGYAIYYAKVPADNGEYLMDHQRIFYLMDPDGKPIAILPHEKNAQAIADELTRWVS
ncbi:MAG TPA: SCO family protein [Allosphingosinicella sp.]|jgi:protein SCO1/2